MLGFFVSGREKRPAVLFFCVRARKTRPGAQKQPMPFTLVVSVVQEEVNDNHSPFTWVVLWLLGRDAQAPPCIEDDRVTVLFESRAVAEARATRVNESFFPLCAHVDDGGVPDAGGGRGPG